MNTNKRGAAATPVIVGVLVALLVLIGGYLLLTRPGKNGGDVTSVNSTTTTAVNNATNTPSTDGSDTVVAGTTTRVKLYYIAIEDAGKSGKKIGCNDSVVPVNVDIPATRSPLVASYEKLLANKSRDYGQSGFINSLYQSNLKIDSASVVNGVANIKLSGTMSLGGVCDAPRFQAQLEETALQFPTVKSVNITINGKSLQSVLSEKGE